MRPAERISSRRSNFLATSDGGLCARLLRPALRRRLGRSGPRRRRSRATRTVAQPSVHPSRHVEVRPHPALGGVRSRLFAPTKASVIEQSKMCDHLSKLGQGRDRWISNRPGGRGISLLLRRRRERRRVRAQVAHLDRVDRGIRQVRIVLGRRRARGAALVTVARGPEPQPNARRGSE